ncbi:hypothetical protein CsSME_00004990 [Camellia sinensis var. sinensis]
MAGAVENFSSDAAATASAYDDDIKFGFQRPEMYQNNLTGTVDPYDRHVFLCYKNHDSWPPRVEDSDSDPLPKLLSGALKARKNDLNVKTRLTICEGRDGTEFSDGDVLIFLEMIKYRDQRCGVCGPALIEKFNEEIELRGLKDQVFVSACSHVGGHKYAGNLIIFSTDQEGNIAGHWYGYVTPNDVADLLEKHIGKGEIIENLWRGQMGVPVEQAEKVNKQKIPNGKVMEKSEKPHGDISQDKKEDVASCCQGANGFSCCRDGSSEIKEITEVQEKKGLGKLSSWMGKWEESDVLAAVAVFGAVATIAVAYSFYRRSG